MAHRGRTRLISLAATCAVVCGSFAIIATTARASQTNPAEDVYAFGDAPFYGSTGNLQLAQPIVGIAGTASGNGYYEVATDGGIFSFGDARFLGSTGAIQLNKPIVGMAVTPSGNGYWLVATDGGIFAFGDAAFYGSTGSIQLNQPITGMASTSVGRGYWLVARDGGMFAFGNAGFYGSMGGVNLGTKSVIGMAASTTGHGYWLVATRAIPPPPPPTTAPGTSPPTTTPGMPANPGDAKNCSDFATYADAKAWYDTYAPFYGDVANLDSDGDGIPCESLAGAP